MKRKSLIWLVAVILVIFSYGLTCSQESVVNLNAVSDGNELEVIVNLANTNNAVAVQFDIVYDKNALEPITDVTPSDALISSGFNVQTSNPSSGVIRVIIIPPIISPLPVLPNGTLLRVKFSKLLENASVPVLKNIVLSDASGN